MKTPLGGKHQPPPHLQKPSARSWLSLCLLGMIFAAEVLSHAETAMEAWVRRYAFAGLGSEDSPSKVVADPAGNVIVAGYTDEHSDPSPDMLLIKYSGAGGPLWTNRYNGTANAEDTVTDIAADASGNVVITGPSIGRFTGYDFATIKYSAAGVPLWTNRYAGSGLNNENPTAIAVDANGNIFVTGATGVGNNDYATVAYSGAGVPLWTNRYSGPGNDGATAIAVDAGGNVFATGYSASKSTFPPDYAFATIKYSSSGIPIWTNRYNGPGNRDDLAISIAVDSGGNVIVAGRSPDATSTDYATIKYSDTGAPLWTNRFKASADSTNLVRAMAVDASGNVFVTGLSRASGIHATYATVAYSGAGVPLWTNRLDAPDNNETVAAAIAVDATGNVVVTGSLTDQWGFIKDYATVAYSGAGAPLWTNYGNAYARDMSVDSDGNVFVTGSSTGDSDTDWVTTAYSSAGAPLWANIYDGPDSTREDYAAAVAIDFEGNLFVTGPSYEATGTLSDYTTIKYSSAGVPLWTNRYNGPGNYDDRATVSAVDANGNVFVTGYSFEGSSSASDFATIAYSGAGEALWTNRFNGAGNEADVANGIAVDASGNVFVTGSSFGAGTSSDFATIKYSGAGLPLWTNLYNGPANGADGADAIAVDASGNVFVTGFSVGSDGFAHYATIAYSGAGAPLWTNRYHRAGGGDNAAAAIAVSSSSNILVTGSSATTKTFPFRFDFTTIAYSPAGLPLWTNRYNGPANGEDSARAIAVDGSGNIFVTGESAGSGTSFDYATIKYSGIGLPLWTNRYNGPTNAYDLPFAIAVDPSGNVFVTGASTPQEGSSDYVTIKYSGAGLPLWTNRYDGPAHGPDQTQGKASLAIGPDGAAYITGASDGVNGSGTGFDFATVKYVTVPVLAIQPPVGGSSDVHLLLSGAPYSVWTVERALALSGPWTDLATVTIPANGSAPVYDPTPPKSATFYRARQ